MAGQPKRRAVLEALEARATTYFDDDPSQTALDYVACWIESGKTLIQLADDLKDDKGVGFTVNREWIGQTLRKAFGGERTDARLSSARAHASHVLAEDSLTISDDDASTSVDVARNGLRARSRQWVAERWNPQQYGSSKTQNVSISITSLHLDALRAAPNTVTGSLNRVAEAPSQTVAEAAQPVAIASVSES